MDTSAGGKDRRTHRCIERQEYERKNQDLKKKKHKEPQMEIKAMSLKESFIHPFHEACCFIGKLRLNHHEDQAG